MMVHCRKLIPALALTTAVACNDPSSPAPAKITSLPRELSTTEQAIAQASNTFAFSLLRAVNKSFADSNVFISPLSASMALGMALNGTATETHAEMRTTLGLTSGTMAEVNQGYKSLIDMLRALDRNVDFRIANAVWYRDTFGPDIEPSFLSTTRTFFDARVEGLDFTAPGAVTAINDWVKSSTNGKIDKMVDQIPSEIVMYLMNAIYFKGNWREQFDPKRTAAAEFTTNRNQVVTAQMMTRRGGFRVRRLSVGTTAVELPYGGDAFVMTAILPPENTDVNAFIDVLTPQVLDVLTTEMDDPRMILNLPKFRLAWEDEFNDELKSLGMQRAFEPDGADFTPLSARLGHNLYISKVRQKTFVDVNEEGTEAAAVTSVDIGVTSFPGTIDFNRPFVFVIRERLTGTILFIGKIVRPVV
jgi:serine protease inhibitor